METIPEKKAPRQPRAAKTRAVAERSFERAPIAYFNNSKFTIPPMLREAYPHKIFGWIRVAFQNSGEDEENFDNKINQGWEPVLSSLCPELKNRQTLSPFERKAGADELIRRSGHILMWMDKSLYDQREAYYDEMKYRQGQMSSLCTEGGLHTIVDERSMQYRR